MRSPSCLGAASQTPSGLIDNRRPVCAVQESHQSWLGHHVPHSNSSERMNIVGNRAKKPIVSVSSGQ